MTFSIVKLLFSTENIARSIFLISEPKEITNYRIFATYKLYITFVVLSMRFVNMFS